MTEDRTKLVEDNLRLVHWVIRHKMRVAKEDYEDAYQDGCVGLVKAAQTFDETKGVAFTSYAVRCIWNEIRQLRRRMSCKVKHEELNSNAKDDRSTDVETQVCIRDMLRRAGELDTRGMLRMWADGHTQQEIANKLGVSQSYVSRKIKQMQKELRNYV